MNYGKNHLVYRDAWAMSQSSGNAYCLRGESVNMKRIRWGMMPLSAACSWRRLLILHKLCKELNTWQINTIRNQKHGMPKCSMKAQSQKLARCRLILDSFDHHLVRLQNDTPVQTREKETFTSFCIMSTYKPSCWSRKGTRCLIASARCNGSRVLGSTDSWFIHLKIWSYKKRVVNQSRSLLSTPALSFQNYRDSLTDRSVNIHMNLQQQKLWRQTKAKKDFAFTRQTLQTAYTRTM